MAFPELRFPEFVDSEGWKSDLIGKVCSSYSGGTPTTTEPSYYGGHIPFIRSAEINKNETELFLTTDGLYNSSAKEVNKGDVLIALYGANSGDVAISKIDGAINQAILCLKSKQNNEFIYQYLTFEKENIISTFIQGGQGNLSGEIIKSVRLFFPNPNEQKKIAECFRSLDDLISAVTDKIEVLKEHKKGLMQQLFPTEGSTVPALRFPEFQNTPEWKEEYCDAFFSIGSSKRVLQEDWTTQGVPFYRTRELVSLSKQEAFSNEIFISESLFKELSEKYGLPSEGDFLVSGVGTLGVCHQVKANDKFYFKDGNVLWFKMTGELHSTYFKYCFLSKHIQNQIIGQTAKSTVGTYTIQNAKKTKFWCPPTPKEQQVVADCLSSIDDQITSEQQKLEQLKVHKKGLMQRLFPKV